MNFLGQRKSGYLCISLLFAELGDVSRKNTFRGDLKSAVWWYQNVLLIHTDFAKGFPKKSEKDKENYQFQGFF